MRTGSRGGVIRAALGSAALISAVLVSTLALAGCTATNAVTPSPSASASETESALRPIVPKTLSAETAKPETVRLAAAIEKIIPSKSIVYVDNKEQLVAASETAASFYGVLRTATLTPTVDPIATAAKVTDALKAAGWVQVRSSVTDGVQVVALASGSDAATSWFVVVSGDPTTVDQSVVAIQLASPDLP